MASLPRPLLALLIAVVALAAAWMLVLKPSSSSNSSANVSTPPAPQVIKTAPVTAVKSTAVKSTAAKSTAAKSTAAKSTAAHSTKPVAKSHPAPVAAMHAHKTTLAQSRPKQLAAALSAHKVIALLFYNAAGSDDNAMRSQVMAIPDHSGKVFKLAAPISDVTKYPFVTTNVAVTGSPTLIVIDRKGTANTLVGFADQLEINQMVSAALAAK